MRNRDDSHAAKIPPLTKNNYRYNYVNANAYDCVENLAVERAINSSGYESYFSLFRNFEHLGTESLHHARLKRRSGVCEITVKECHCKNYEFESAQGKVGLSGRHSNFQCICEGYYNNYKMEIKQEKVRYCPWLLHRTLFSRRIRVRDISTPNRGQSTPTVPAALIWFYAFNVAPIPLTISRATPLCERSPGREKDKRLPDGCGSLWATRGPNDAILTKDADRNARVCEVARVNVTRRNNIRYVYLSCFAHPACYLPCRSALLAHWQYIWPSVPRVPSR